MANSWVHATTSARHFRAGTPEDYHPLHLWVDQFKSQQGDVRHRAFLHHTNGPFMAEQQFGPYIEVEKWPLGSGVMIQIPTRDVAETHIIEDLGWLPTPADWMSCMDCKVWMGGKRNKIINRGELLDAVVDIPNPTR